MGRIACQCTSPPLWTAISCDRLALLFSFPSSLVLAWARVRMPDAQAGFRTREVLAFLSLYLSYSFAFPLALSLSSSFLLSSCRHLACLRVLVIGHAAGTTDDAVSIFRSWGDVYPAGQ